MAVNVKPALLYNIIDTMGSSKGGPAACPQSQVSLPLPLQTKFLLSVLGHIE